jgi:hypothetical protein
VRQTSRRPPTCSSKLASRTLKQVGKFSKSEVLKHARVP